MDIKVEFQKAKNYVFSKGRKLEQARFNFAFGNGTKEDVIKELKYYQNKDGGFGNAIEPDFWLPSSSAMATWAAAQILYELDAEQEEPIIQDMVSYLVATNKFETGMWESVLPENNDYPHAPWWHWQEDVQKNWMFNPSIELAAYLIHWSNDRSEASEIGWNTIIHAVAYLMDQTEMDMHEIQNFLKFVKVIKPYEFTFNTRTPYLLDDLLKKIIRLADNSVEKDPTSWNEGYSALPLDFVESPQDLLYEKFSPLIKRNLEFYINQLNKDGVWEIAWEWGTYPEEFKQAKQYWKGILAVNRYKQLQAFGYVL